MQALVPGAPVPATAGFARRNDRPTNISITWDPGISPNQTQRQSLWQSTSPARRLGHVLAGAALSVATATGAQAVVARQATQDSGASIDGMAGNHRHAAVTQRCAPDTGAHRVRRAVSVMTRMVRGSAIRTHPAAAARAAITANTPSRTATPKAGIGEPGGSFVVGISAPPTTAITGRPLQQFRPDIK